MFQCVGYAAETKRSKLAPFSFERRDPGPKDVRIDIMYCGVCHSDLHQVRDEWGNTVFPCLPGHEIVGRVAAVGAEVTRFKAGDLAGVGCMVDSCQRCAACGQGLEQYCENGFLATYNGPFKPDGSNTFGGYSQSIVVTEQFVLAIPEGLDPAQAAPILCAGVTTWSPLTRWKVGPGQTVGVVGLGGLGHMAIKLATAMGARVVAFTTSADKEADARRFGAVACVLSTDADAMKEHAGKLDFILSTVPSPYDVNPYLELLRRDAALVNVGVLEKLDGVNNGLLAFQRRTLAGSLIGSLAETRDVLEFCARHGIAPEIEMIPIDRIDEAYERMMREEVHFRYVIDMASLRAAR